MHTRYENIKLINISRLILNNLNTLENVASGQVSPVSPIFSIISPNVSRMSLYYYIIHLCVCLSACRVYIVFYHV